MKTQNSSIFANLITNPYTFAHKKIPAVFQLQGLFYLLNALFTYAVCILRHQRRKTYSR